MSLITGLDHLVVLTRDIDAGIATTRALLGCEPAWRASSEASETAVFTLANVSLELVAPGKGLVQIACKPRSIHKAKGSRASVFASATSGK